MYYGLDDNDTKWPLVLKCDPGNLNADGCNILLSESPVLLIKLNYGVSWWLQVNFPVNKSKKVKEFMKNSRISVLKSPAKIPNLNIVEDYRKTISDLVYDAKQIKSIDELVNKITSVINYLNQCKRNKVRDLYRSIGSLL